MLHSEPPEDGAVTVRDFESIAVGGRHSFARTKRGGMCIIEGIIFVIQKYQLSIRLHGSRCFLQVLHTILHLFLAFVAFFTYLSFVFTKIILTLQLSR